VQPTGLVTNAILNSGIVKSNSDNLPIGKATVILKGNSHTTTTTNNGEYWRLLLPGQYEISISAPRYANIK